jgi:hypothetical protein
MGGKYMFGLRAYGMSLLTGIRYEDWTCEELL